MFKINLGADLVGAFERRGFANLPSAI